ncbi:hypothetical protein QE152_g35203 [Popillia japonica]|uniref:Uncharacterized protein n=1 Tax=Popillia japonica TaxID=7064 RepID=A0AAW1IGT5_POPJA
MDGKASTSNYNRKRLLSDTELEDIWNLEDDSGEDDTDFEPYSSECSDDSSLEDSDIESTKEDYNEDLANKF